MIGKKKGSAKPTLGRRPYKKPELVVHGDLRTLTRAKGSVFNDGSGKPRTRQFFSSSG
jgi:hypothetical protein